MKQVTDKLFQIDLGVVNAYVIEDNGLTLIDTGLPGSMEKIFASIKKSGKNPQDIKQIILTHCHTDHAGNAAELKQLLNVPVYAHQEDAELLKQGISSRPTKLTPGFINWMVYHLVIKKAGNAVAPVAVDNFLKDNDLIHIAGGIRVIHTPGHSAGHIALLLESDDVLIAGDVCANIPSLAYSTLYEDFAIGRQSILKVAELKFNKAVFGHGNPLLKNAAEKIKAKFK